MGNLSGREKIVVAGGGVLCLIFIMVQFVFLPAFDEKRRLEGVLDAALESLVQIRQLEKEYTALASDYLQEKSEIRNRGNGFSLFALIDQKATANGVKGHIEYMKPEARRLEDAPFTLSTVKLKLKQAFLRDLIRFMDDVESPATGIRMASLTMNRTGKDKKRLDAVIEVQALIPAEDG